MEPLAKVDPNYPKAMYKLAPNGIGDVKSPAYEKIVMKDGQAQRQVEWHPYVTCTVVDEKEEKKLGKDWVDHPDKLGIVAAV